MITNRKSKEVVTSNETSSISVSASGKDSGRSPSTERDWTNLNGDGLPDMLAGNEVRYNLGYFFTNDLLSKKIIETILI